MNTRLALGVIVTVMGMIILGTGTMLPSYSSFKNPPQPKEEAEAPAVISGDNVYIVWPNNNDTVFSPNGNFEVVFRASTDGGATYGNKTNLSNTPNSNSVDALIAAEGGNVLVTWWERNQTSGIPVARMSTDSGTTFGPVMVLSANGTLREVAPDEESEPEEEG